MIDFEALKAQDRATQYIIAAIKCRHKIEWHRINSFQEQAFCNKCWPPRLYIKDDFTGESTWVLANPIPEKPQRK